MGAARHLFPILALLASACGGSGAKADLEMAGSARSLMAEWAILLESRPSLTDTYSVRMREEAARQLSSVAAKARRNDGPASLQIADLATLPPDPSPAMLHERAARAQAIEGRLEAR
jgi:hypothetical protein